MDLFAGAYTPALSGGILCRQVDAPVDGDEEGAAVEVVPDGGHQPAETGDGRGHVDDALLLLLLMVQVGGAVAVVGGVVRGVVAVAAAVARGHDGVAVGGLARLSKCNIRQTSKEGSNQRLFASTDRCCDADTELFTLLHRTRHCLRTVDAASYGTCSVFTSYHSFMKSTTDF